MRSLEIMESLVKKDPGRTDWQRELGVSLDNVGNTRKTGRRRRDLGALSNTIRSTGNNGESGEERPRQRTDWQRRDLGSEH